MQPSHMQQPQYGNTQSSSRRIALNLDYLCSIIGLLQLNIIVNFYNFYFVIFSINISKKNLRLYYFAQ